MLNSCLDRDSKIWARKALKKDILTSVGDEFRGRVGITSVEHEFRALFLEEHEYESWVLITNMEHDLKSMSKNYQCES